MSRGGARPGAGRKRAAVPLRPLSLRASEETIARVQALRQRGVDINGAFARMISDLWDTDEGAE